MHFCPWIPDIPSDAHRPIPVHWAETSHLLARRRLISINIIWNSLDSSSWSDKCRLTSKKISKALHLSCLCICVLLTHKTHDKNVTCRVMMNDLIRVWLKRFVVCNPCSAWRYPAQDVGKVILLVLCDNTFSSVWKSMLVYFIWQDQLLCFKAVELVCAHIVIWSKTKMDCFLMLVRNAFRLPFCLGHVHVWQASKCPVVWYVLLASVHHFPRSLANALLLGDIASSLCCQGCTKPKMPTKPWFYHCRLGKFHKELIDDSASPFCHCSYGVLK